MSTQSITKRIEKLEGGKSTFRQAFKPDRNGIIPDEFEPDLDLLIVTTIVSPDGSHPKELNPPLMWRGKPYESDDSPSTQPTNKEKR